METYVYILMPLISAMIGYVTNVIAIKMTFYPLEFRGIKPFFGWQGIIPSKAEKMAVTATELLTRDLFKPKEIFARLDIKEIIRLTDSDFREMANQITETVLDSRMPISNTILGRGVRLAVSEAVAKSLPDMISNSMNKVKENIEQILDLKSLAVSIMKEDKSLINKIFLDLGDKQFRFIETSGLWLGFLFGFGQIAVSMFFNHWVMYVLYGVFIGYITNYLALKMIFEPEEPKKIGPFTLWGLFLRNQRAESYKYADIIANRIVTAENCFNYIFSTPANAVTRRIMEQEVSRVVDNVFGQLPPMVRLAVTNQKLSELKSVTLFHLLHEMPLHIGVIYPYADVALDVRNSIGEKMSKLPPHQFIDFLRPAFQDDEWKLIAVGSALGGMAGMLQSML